jgi:A/G-specific adenine glycosylase
LIFKSLTKWHLKENKREMPWKGIHDPYKIWLSEIILQQTRVEQGITYYLNFIIRYPTIKHLAKASEQELFSMWQGLGYYNRCRNLHTTAKYIAEELNGVFPSKYESILSLKGIGEYTAAAIASFAFKLPYAVVDGNVVRVLSRLFCLKTNFYSSNGKKAFQQLAQSLLDKKNPDLYNQAIMDLGATICKPQQPLCIICPLIKYCKAHATESIDFFPIKKIKAPVKHRNFHFLVFSTATQFYLTQRVEKDIWQDLFTFYMIETPLQLNKKHLPNSLKKQSIPEPILIQQTLSHQQIHGYFYVYENVKAAQLNDLNLIKVAKKDLGQYAFPKIMMSFFEKLHYL